jgi:hypothetical protein
VRRSGLTPEQKAKLALYDNRTAELAEWDSEALAKIGKDIDLGDFGLQWAIGELINPNELWKGMPEFGNDPKAARTIHVHFETMNSVAAFAAMIGQHITEQTRFIWYPEKPKDDTLSLIFGHES